MLAKLRKRKRLRTHWFLKRSSTDNGKNVLKARRRITLAWLLAKMARRF